MQFGCRPLQLADTTYSHASQLNQGMPTATQPFKSHYELIQAASLQNSLTNQETHMVRRMHSATPCPQQANGRFVRGRLACHPPHRPAA